MSNELKLRCQRCGAQMEMRDPEPGGAWKPDQFWVCPTCGRHFWTTYANPPKPAGEATAAPVKPAGEAVAPAPAPAAAAGATTEKPA
jgi:DNA-directed RNA polymerase subunit RPC12/RpoP